MERECRENERERFCFPFLFRWGEVEREVKKERFSCFDFFLLFSILECVQAEFIVFFFF